MLHHAGPMLAGCNLPQLFKADAELRRLAALVEFKMPDQRFGQAAARALREQRVFRAQLHAAREAVLRLAVATDAHVARCDTCYRAVLIEHLGGRKARVDLNAERFGLGGEPAAHFAERYDEVAVI